MTHRMYDPINLSSYPETDPPAMLHFQWKGSSDIFRYVLAERIPQGAMVMGTRRKVGEVGDEAEIAAGYLKQGIKIVLMDADQVAWLKGLQDRPRINFNAGEAFP